MINFLATVRSGKRGIQDAILVIVLASSVAGCGGSSGSPTSSVLSVSTDWSNRGSPGGGLSEKLSLFDSNGLLVQELVVNQDVPGLMRTDFAKTLPGNYLLSAELWSQTNLSGVQTGSFKKWITINPSASVTLDIGQPPAELIVTPSTASIQAQHSQQFYASLKDAAGHFVFTSSSQGTIQWTSLGGVTSIDPSTGLAIGTSSGAGSVRATYSPGTILGGAAVTVSSFVITQSKWTVLLYLNAANDLDQFSAPNVVQMQKVAGAPANVRFIVQWKQAAIPGVASNPSFVGTRRYQISYSAANANVSELIQDLGPTIDMGSPQTMADFLNWGKTYFPADRYCVVIWNHGNGWAPGRTLATDLPTRGFSYDDDTGNHINTWQLGQALGTLTPDIIAWDSSLMQMAEVAYEARSQAKYMVGSEESPPGAGYPYDVIFANFRDRPDDSSLNLSKSFVDGMLAFYAGSGQKITQSVFDESQISSLATAITGLSDSLIANRASVATLIPWIRANAGSYSDSSPFGRLYRDIYQVCDLLKTGGGGNAPAPLSVQDAASSVQSSFNNVVLYERHNSLSSYSHGMSVSFYDSSTYVGLAPDYTNLGFAQNTSWEDWLAISP